MCHWAYHRNYSFQQGGQIIENRLHQHSSATLNVCQQFYAGALEFADDWKEMYSSTCHERTLTVQSQSVPSWQVVPRGRDRKFDTNIYGHTSRAHIVYAVLMHKQNRCEMKVGRYLSHVLLHAHYTTVYME